MKLSLWNRPYLVSSIACLISGEMISVTFPHTLHTKCMCPLSVYEASYFIPSGRWCLTTSLSFKNSFSVLYKVALLTLKFFFNNCSLRLSMENRPFIANTASRTAYRSGVLRCLLVSRYLSRSSWTACITSFFFFFFFFFLFL